jgi:hypothetical protein
MSDLLTSEKAVTTTQRTDASPGSTTVQLSTESPPTLKQSANPRSKEGSAPHLTSKSKSPPSAAVSHITVWSVDRLNGLDATPLVRMVGGGGSVVDQVIAKFSTDVNAATRAQRTNAPPGSLAIQISSERLEMLAQM